MSQLITIDPVTRIEGHLRVDVEVEGGAVRDAWSSGTMWRGIEQIVRGRDPRDAWVFTQRICGVCTTVHAIASVRSVEDALGLHVPMGAQLVRNLMISAHALHDHLVHFYALSALDWVDVPSAAGADPARAARLAEGLSAWPGNSRQALAAVKERLAGFVKEGRLGIFAQGYWGHPAMRLTPEQNLLAVAHYLQALEVQRAATQAVAILGGKTPNVQNLAVGGVANAIDLDGASALNMEKLFTVREHLDEVAAFVRQVYLPDVAMLAAAYPDWLRHGVGVTNYLAVPDLPLDEAMTQFDLPGGVVWSGGPGLARPLTGWADPWLRQHVTESIAHAHYDGNWSRGPWEEETVPKIGPAWAAGTPAPDRYSFVKAPRLEGKPVQVGPLAQVLVGLASHHEPTVRWTTALVDAARAGHGAALHPGHLQSTLGRHAARAIRCAVLSELAQKHWRLLVDLAGTGKVPIFTDPLTGLPKGELRGVGLHEAPRGALSHWIVIASDGKAMKTTNYQAVVPSTWNAGPRDAEGHRGPYEEALLGNPVADARQPLEVLRTLHSFDPCLACAVHAVEVGGA